MWVLFGTDSNRSSKTTFPLSLSKLKSLETRPAKDEDIKARFTDAIENDINKGYFSKLETIDTSIKFTFWYLPHHPVLNPNQPENVNKGCTKGASYTTKDWTFGSFHRYKIDLIVG